MNSASDMRDKEKLTDREVEIMKLYIEGSTSKEVAENLDISYHTVEAHKQNMLNKFGARNLIQLAVILIRQKLL